MPDLPLYPHVLKESTSEEVCKNLNKILIMDNVVVDFSYDVNCGGIHCGDLYL